MTQRPPDRHPLTPRSSLNPRRPVLRAWDSLAGRQRWVLTLLALTLLSIALSAASIRAATHNRSAQLLLADTTAAANWHRALEWRALGAGTLDPRLRGEVQASRDALLGLQQQLQSSARRETGAQSTALLHEHLERQHVRGGSLENLAGLLGTYVQATDEEFALLLDGDPAGARNTQRMQVDPLASRVREMLAELRWRRDHEVRQSLGFSVGLVGLTLLACVITLSLLNHRLRQSLRRTRLLERQQQEEYEREERDPLTGVWNRRGLERLFVRHTAGQELSVLVLDLNRLKRVNDIGGHGAGDAWLRRVALALREVSAPQELVARLGGDEFVVVLPGVSEQGAGQVAAQASALLETPGDLLPPFAYGVARVTGVTSLERVLALADAAMYEHKELQRQELARLGPDARVGLTVEEFAARLEALETPQEVLGEGLSLACQVLEFQGSVYLERLGEGFVLRQVGGDLGAGMREQLEGRVYHAGEGVTGQVIGSGATRWSNDYPSEPYALETWVQAGLKSVLIVPVRHGGRLMGMIGLLHYASWRVITPQVRQLAETVASRLGHTFERVQAVENVRSALQGGLLALGVALEERDLETAGHTERVVNLAGGLGSRLGLSDSRLDALRQGASLHDIGKLVIPDAILLKPGPLDAQEWQVMRHHAERGHDIAHRLSGLMPSTLEIIRSHHERWDGSGYPDGLAGKAIPLAARIFAVCDVYDALTHTRPYKLAWPHDDALAEIRAQSGVHFDPQVVEAFIELIEDERRRSELDTVVGGGTPALDPASG